MMEEDLIEHQRSEHTKKEGDPPGNDEYPCPHCDFVGISDRGLKKHITQQHPIDTDPPETPQNEQSDGNGDNNTPTTSNGLYGGKTWAECNDFFYDELGKERFDEIIDAHGITNFGNINSSQRMRLYNAWKAALDVKVSS